MTMFHKALAAALLCGAVGFAIPSYAAAADTSSSTTGATTDKSSANATDANTPAKPAKRVVRARTPAVDEEHSIVDALNQKSLQGVESGQTPDFASAEPASHQQAEAARAAKTEVRHRTNTKASAKKTAG